MAYQDLIVDRKGRVGLITLNRPKALNALCDSLVRELGVAFDDLEGATGVRNIVVRAPNVAADLQPSGVCFSTRGVELVHGGTAPQRELARVGKRLADAEHPHRHRIRPAVGCYGRSVRVRRGCLLAPERQVLNAGHEHRIRTRAGGTDARSGHFDAVLRRAQTRVYSHGAGY